MKKILVFRKGILALVLGLSSLGICSPAFADVDVSVNNVNCRDAGHRNLCYLVDDHQGKISILANKGSSCEVPVERYKYKIVTQDACSTGLFDEEKYRETLVHYNENVRVINAGEREYQNEVSEAQSQGRDEPGEEYNNPCDRAERTFLYNNSFAWIDGYYSCKLDAQLHWTATFTEPTPADFTEQSCQPQTIGTSGRAAAVSQARSEAQKLKSTGYCLENFDHL